MIKIVHILNSVGGVDTSLRLLVENIDSTRFETIIIHGRKDNTNFVDNKRNAVKEYFLPIERNISILKDLKCIIKAWQIIRKENPDIIHGHSAKGGLIANFLGIFLKSKPIFHTPQAYSYLSTSSKIKRKFYVYIERFVKNRNSILLASSESELKRGLIDIKYSEEKALLFNNCIDDIELTKTYSNSEYKLPENYICTVGRPSYQKNIEMMVEIINEVKKTIPDIHLVVLGLGVVSPNTESVKNLISKFKLESNTTLIEWIDRKKIFDIVKKSKFYLSTARYEGLPYAIIESLALSKAIIATDCDGNRDLVKNNHNGFLINQGDVKDAESKIIELYKDSNKRRKFEENSLKMFHEGFNINKNISLLENIYLNYSIK